MLMFFLFLHSFWDHIFWDKPGETLDQRIPLKQTDRLNRTENTNCLTTLTTSYMLNLENEFIN